MRKKREGQISLWYVSQSIPSEKQVLITGVLAFSFSPEVDCKVQRSQLWVVIDTIQYFTHIPRSLPSFPFLFFSWSLMHFRSLFFTTFPSFLSSASLFPQQRVCILSFSLVRCVGTIPQPQRLSDENNLAITFSAGRAHHDRVYIKRGRTRLFTFSEG